MFKKLFKYDFKSIKRIGIPLLIAMLGVTIVGALGFMVFMSTFKSFGYQTEPSDDQMMLQVLSMMLSMVLIGVAILAVSVFGTVIQILICVDFYKTTVTDEAYLTFTLPVKAKDIIFSKMLNSIVWNLIFTVASLLSIFLMLGAGLLMVTDEINLVVEAFNEAMASSGAPSMEELFGPYIDDYTFVVITTIIYSVISFINNQLLLFMTIFMASIITRKQKLLVAILLVIGVNTVYSWLITGITEIISFILGVTSITVESMMLSTGITMIIMSVLVAGLTVLFFFLTKNMMEKKLNLD